VSLPATSQMSQRLAQLPRVIATIWRAPVTRPLLLATHTHVIRSYELRAVLEESGIRTLGIFLDIVKPMPREARSGTQSRGRLNNPCRQPTDSPQSGPNFESDLSRVGNPLSKAAMQCGQAGFRAAITN